MTLGLEWNSYALFLLKKIVSTLKYGQNNEGTHFSIKTGQMNCQTVSGPVNTLEICLLLGLEVRGT